jgi:hypothetical protein
MPPIGQGGFGLEYEAIVANSSPNKGFYQDYPLAPIVNGRSSAGLVLTAGTNPIVAKVGNVWTVSWAATDTSTLVLPWTVPNEFNDRTKEFTVWALFGKTGTTDAVTITPTMYTRGQYGAEKAIPMVTSRVYPTASTYTDGTTTFIIPAATTTAPIACCMNFTPAATQAAPYIAGGDALTLNLAVGTHGTDGINLYGLWVRLNRFGNLAPYLDATGYQKMTERFEIPPTRIG